MWGNELQRQELNPPVVFQPSGGTWGCRAASRLRETPAGFPQSQYFWLRFYAVSLGIAMGFPCLDPSTAKHLFQNTELHVCIRQPGACAFNLTLGLAAVLKLTGSALQVQLYEFSLFYLWRRPLTSPGSPRSVGELSLEPTAGAAALLFVVGLQEGRTGWVLATTPSPAPHLPQQLKNKFIKKIPKDAEASNVLVGEVEFLEKPFVAFVRLLQATMLGGVTEVPVPTR